jgi:predicted dehydrogenase
MRFAFAGLGSALVRGHLPAVLRLPGTVVRAGADPHAERRASFAARQPEAAVFDDAAEMIREVDADVIVLATDPASHAALAAAAVARGRHVLCEKPAAVDRDAVEILERACARRPDLALISVHQYRYSPGWRRVRRLARTVTLLRQPASLDILVDRLGPDPLAATSWRTGETRAASVFADHFVHFVALAEDAGLHPYAIAADRAVDAAGGESASALLATDLGAIRLAASRPARYRRTAIDFRTRAVELSWDNASFVTTVGHRLTRSADIPSLASRDHVDALYVPFYAELDSCLPNPLWRAVRTMETLRVSRCIVDLLDLADRCPSANA